MKTTVSLSAINLSASPMVRAEIRQDIVEDYTDTYRQDKNTMPEPVLFKSGAEYIVADGMHRIAAMKVAGLSDHPFDVREGTRQDCLKFALQANLHHGARRTNADKRQCVVAALKEFSALSNGQIAEYASVGETLVSEVRAKLESSATIPAVTNRIGKDGRSRGANSPKRGVDEAGPQKNADEKIHAGAVPTKAPTPNPTHDATGYPIPEKALPIWGRREAAQCLIEALCDIRRQLAGYVSAKDILFSEVNLNAADCELEALISRLQAAVPYAVCPTCHGKLVENCTNCGHRGMVSRVKYERTDAAFRKVREKNCVK